MLYGLNHSKSSSRNVFWVSMPVKISCKSKGHHQKWGTGIKLNVKLSLHLIKHLHPEDTWSSGGITSPLWYERYMKWQANKKWHGELCGIAFCQVWLPCNNWFSLLPNCWINQVTRRVVYTVHTYIQVLLPFLWIVLKVHVLYWHICGQKSPVLPNVKVHIMCNHTCHTDGINWCSAMQETGLSQ